MINARARRQKSKNFVFDIIARGLVPNTSARNARAIANKNWQELVGDSCACICFQCIGRPCMGSLLRSNNQLQFWKLLCLACCCYLSPIDWQCIALQGSINSVTDFSKVMPDLAVWHPDSQHVRRVRVFHVKIPLMHIHLSSLRAPWFQIHWPLHLLIHADLLTIQICDWT
jgi:hypothetical protein